MGFYRGESSRAAESVIDLVSVVEDLHRRSSQELLKLLRQKRDLCVSFRTQMGTPSKVDVEKFAGLLPLHLIAVLISSDKNGETFKYILRGIRLLHTLCDIAPRVKKLEKVLLDDLKISEQMLDLVFYLLIVLVGNRQANVDSDGQSLIYATLVTSSLYLLHGFISSQWQDVVQVLLAHPKVDTFMDAAFEAVHNVVRSLRLKLLFRQTGFLSNPGFFSREAVNYHCHQAEAALQFLHSLCQEEPFRDHLAKNKELCEKGGVLMLSQTILSQTIAPEFVGAAKIIASLSRMKAKVLSMLQHLFEAESVPFLHEVASAGNLHLAKPIVSKVLELLKLGFSKASIDFSASPVYPMGFVLLNAMRLAEILTDEPNFRSFFTQHYSEFLSAMFSLSHGDFLMMWCSSDLPAREEEATLDYDLFESAGWILDLSTSAEQPNAAPFKLTLLPDTLPMSSYAHQRTSLFIKMIANLHVFVPNICEVVKSVEQEKSRFVHSIVRGLQKDLSSILPGFSYTLVAQRGASLCRNLRFLLNHAESLLPNFLSEEDFLLLRKFDEEIKLLIRSEYGESQVQETPSTEVLSRARHGDGNGTMDEEMLKNLAIGEEEMKENEGNDEAGGSDTGSTKGKSSPKTNGEGNVQGGIQEEERVEIVLALETQSGKRKRGIMTVDQLSIMEKAVLDEPDMHRNADSIQMWSDILSHHGCEVKCYQLKNWLNNRRAKIGKAERRAERARASSRYLRKSRGEGSSSRKPWTSKRRNRRATRSTRTRKTPKPSMEIVVLSD